MKSLPKGIFWGVAALVAIFAVSFAFFLYSGSVQLNQSVINSLDKFQAGVTDLKNLKPAAAEEKFSAANKSIGSTFGGILSRFESFFGDTGDLVSGFRKLASDGVVLSQEVGFLENNLLSLLLDKKGDVLLAHLNTINDTLSDVNSQSDKLSAVATKIREISPGAVGLYIPLKLDVGRLQKFLATLVGWLGAGSPHHILVMFQNPSEIRPAGGFLGSYADVTISSGSLESMEFHDINDADRQLALNFIPPKPLQAQVTRWRAADANWFFDFSYSAAQVIKFLEVSKLYSDRKITFDGAVAVSPKVIGDILGMIGPVNLKKSQLALNQDNFLQELQKKVQLSQAQGATYPKGALEELASTTLSLLTSLDDAQKQQFFGMAADWVSKKDAMAYFKDNDLEDFSDYYGVSGKVYDLPNGFEGDYLAIVDANIGGGKSDLFVKQNVTLESQIGADGIVSNHLVIDRKHEGNKSPYSWYKAANQDYLQILTPPSSQLVNFKGGYEKNVAAPINYLKNGYSADPLVLQIESSTEKLFNYPAVLAYDEFGKNVFATWSKVNAGAKTEVTFDYKHRLYLAPSDGEHYQFIFEKQAGTQRDYKFSISAPVGFKFKENNLPVYEYESYDPPGRLIINLTLEKI